MIARGELTYIPLGFWLNCSPEQRAQLRAEFGALLVLDVSDLSTSMDAAHARSDARLTEECQKDYDEEREWNDSVGLSVEREV